MDLINAMTGGKNTIEIITVPLGLAPICRQRKSRKPIASLQCNITFETALTSHHYHTKYNNKEFRHYIPQKPNPAGAPLLPDLLRYQTPAVLHIRLRV